MDLYRAQSIGWSPFRGDLRNVYQE